MKKINGNSNQASALRVALGQFPTGVAIATALVLHRGSKLLIPASSEPKRQGFKGIL